MRGLARLAFGLCLALAVAGSAWAQSATINVAGLVHAPKSFTVEQLKKLPAMQRTVTFIGERNKQETSRYVGVSLWTLLEQAGGLADDGKRANLRHTMTVTGRDGYLVVLSLGELDPDFGAKPAMIAYVRDGKPVDAAHGLRLVMPGDKHGGRAVRDVVSITVN